MPDETGPEPTSDEPNAKPKQPQSATDMISRNDFLLFRLQNELERLKTEAGEAKKKASRRLGNIEEGEDMPEDPVQIIEEARRQIERLREATRRSKKPSLDDDEPTPGD